MLSEDYIIRMIQLAVAALLKIVGLRKAGLLDDAQVQIDLALEQLLGLRASRVKNLEDGQILALLTRDGEIDLERLTLTADLFQEEGEIHASRGRTEDSQASFTRALRFDLEVFFQQLDTEHLGREVSILVPDVRKKIDAILAKLQLEHLGPNTLWPICGYYEEIGLYSNAEQLLLQMAAQPALKGDLMPELKAFYERLLLIPESNLAAGGIHLPDIHKKLRQLNSIK